MDADVFFLGTRKGNKNGANHGLVFTGPMVPKGRLLGMVAKNPLRHHPMTPGFLRIPL